MNVILLERFGSLGDLGEEVVVKATEFLAGYVQTNPCLTPSS